MDKERGGKKENKQERRTKRKMVSARKKRGGNKNRDFPGVSTVGTRRFEKKS